MTWPTPNTSRRLRTNLLSVEICIKVKTGFGLREKHDSNKAQTHPSSMSKNTYCELLTALAAHGSHWVLGVVPIGDWVGSVQVDEDELADGEHAETDRKGEHDENVQYKGPGDCYPDSSDPFRADQQDDLVEPGKENGQDNPCKEAKPGKRGVGNPAVFRRKRGQSKEPDRGERLNDPDGCPDMLGFPRVQQRLQPPQPQPDNGNHDDRVHGEQEGGDCSGGVQPEGI